MRLLLLVTACAVFACSSEKKEVHGVNFAVTDQGDTISHFYYPGHEQYAFVDVQGLDSLGFQNDALAKIGGEYILGMVDRVQPTNMYLNFIGAPVSIFYSDVGPESHFLHNEFNLANDYQVTLLENYIDSTDNVVMRYQTLVALDRPTRDSILFQEINFALRESDVVVRIIVYDNLDTREEMRKAVEQAATTLKKSYDNK